MTEPTKTFDVSAGGSTVLYFRGSPDYDALRVEFDGSGSTSADTDLTYAVATESELDTVEADGFGSMDTVQSEAAVDPSAGATDGTTALGRTVAVEVNEQGSTGNAAGTVTLHNVSDEAYTADAYVQR